MGFYLKTEIDVYGEIFECHCVEQTNRAKGTRYKAYANIKGRHVEAQDSSASGAIEGVKRKAKITLD